MIEQTRVLIVDDNPVIRKGLRGLLEEVGDEFAIVGEASTGLEAIEWIDETPVDVVLMDIRMPGMDGIRATAGPY